MSTMALPWKLEIMRRLSKRNEDEMVNFKDIIASHGNLMEQVELLKKNIRSLEYKNDGLNEELLQLQRDGITASGTSGGGGPNVSRLNKKIEELQAKLMEKTEQLLEIHQGKAQAMSQVAELQSKIHKKEEDIVKKDSQIIQLNNKVKNLEKKLAESEESLKSSLSSHKKLSDEHLELQVEFNSQENRMKEVQTQYDRMRLEILKIKAEEADKMNKTTEKEKAQREEKIRKQLEEAAKPKPTLPSLIERRSSSGASRKKPASTPDVVDPSASYPAVLPERVFYQTEAHDGEVSALCFSGNGQYLATGGADKTVKIWTIKQAQEKLEQSTVLTGSRASIMSIQFDHLNKYILAASNDSASRIWTVEDQRPRHTLTGHTAKVFTAKFMDDGQKVITGSDDKTLKIWDLKIRKCVKTLFAGSSCFDLVPANVLGNMIISGHWDRKIRFWDIRGGGTNELGAGVAVNELAIQGRVTSLSLFSKRYMLLCSTRDDTSLRLIDLQQNSITSTFTGFNLSTDWSRACFSPDGQYVAVGASDGVIHTWEPLTGRQHKTKKDNSIHRGDIVGCAWHPKGQIFASIDRNKKLVVWKR